MSSRSGSGSQRMCAESEPSLEFIECLTWLWWTSQSSSVTFSHGCQRGGDRTEVSGRSPVEVCKSEKALQLFDGLGLWSFHECFDLPFVHCYSLLTDDVTEERGAGLMEFTFFSFGVELHEALQHWSDVTIVFLQSVWINQDVVNVYNYPSVEHVSEDVIHERLEDWRTVSKAEGHNQVLVVPTSGRKGRFPFISLSDTNQVVGIA